MRKILADVIDENDCIYFLIKWFNETEIQLLASSVVQLKAHFYVLESDFLADHVYSESDWFRGCERLVCEPVYQCGFANRRLTNQNYLEDKLNFLHFITQISFSDSISFFFLLFVFFQDCWIDRLNHLLLNDSPCIFAVINFDYKLRLSLRERELYFFSQGHYCLHCDDTLVLKIHKLKHFWNLFFITIFVDFDTAQAQILLESQKAFALLCIRLNQL